MSPYGETRSSSRTKVGRSAEKKPSHLREVRDADGERWEGAADKAACAKRYKAGATGKQNYRQRVFQSRKSVGEEVDEVDGFDIACGSSELA